MTNQLIPTTTAILNGEMQAVIDARTLHTFLESKQKFSDWFNHRIQSYGFTKKIDFIKLRNLDAMRSLEVNHKIRKNSEECALTNNLGGRESKDYGLSLDMAKELCMLERNEKGRIARRYFIAMEREAKQGLINQSQLVKALLDAKPEIAILKRYVEMGLSSVEMGKLMDKHPDTIRRALHKYSKIGVITWQPNRKFQALRQIQITKGIKKEVVQMALTLESEANHANH